MRLKVKVTGPRRIDLKIPVRCPACGRTMQVVARGATPGREIRCACGKGVITISGDGLRGVQRSLDGLLDSVHRLGK